MEMVSRCPSNRIGNGRETWPNTTFALVYSFVNETQRLSEGVLVGPRCVLTLSRNLVASGQPPTRIQVGVSWDGVAEAERSDATARDIPPLRDADTEEVATIWIEKDFSEKYGYLGLRSFEDLSGEALFVYAFRRGERKSEVVPICGPRVHGDRLVYDLLPEHEPIAGAAILCRGQTESYDLVGFHLGNDPQHNHALFMTNSRISKIKELAGQP